MAQICPTKSGLDHFTAKLVLKWKTCAFCSLDLSEVDEPSSIDLTNCDDFAIPTSSVAFRAKLRQENANPSEQALYVPDAKPSDNFLAAVLKGSQEREASVQQTKKQLKTKPTADIGIHLWLASYYETDLDGIPILTYIRVQSAKKFIGTSQFLLTITFTSHLEMMRTILAKFTSEKHFLERDWKAMPINAKHPTDMCEFRGAAYEARTLGSFLQEASIAPEKDVYTLALVSQTRVDPPTSDHKVSKKLRVKQHLVENTAIKEGDYNEPAESTCTHLPTTATRSKTGTERKLTAKAKEAKEQPKKRSVSRKRAISQVDQSEDEGITKIEVTEEIITKDEVDEEVITKVESMEEIHVKI